MGRAVFEDGLNKNFQAVQAILIYKEQEDILATTHKISGGQIGPGKALKRGDLNRLFHNIPRPELGFLPSNVLAVAEQSIIWHCRNHHSPIFFRVSREDGKNLNRYNGTEITWPHLLFKYESGTLYVWALKGNRRPALTAKLYYAPFMNVYDNGRVCMPQGFGRDFKNCDIAGQIAAIETAFFNSAFTHLNSSKKIIDYRGGHGQFWDDYCRKSKEEAVPGKFRNEVLVPTGFTLKGIFSR